MSEGWGRSQIKNITYTNSSKKWGVRFTNPKGERIWVGAYSSLYEAAKNLAKAQSSHGMSLQNSAAVKFLKRQDQLQFERQKQPSIPKKEIGGNVWETVKKILKNSNITINVNFK